MEKWVTRVNSFPNTVKILKKVYRRVKKGTKKLHVKCWWNSQHHSISSTCLCAAFTPADPQNAKSCLSWLTFLLLLGLAYVKAARKHVDEIASTTPCLVCFLYLVSSSSNSCPIEVFREVGSGSENFSNFIFVKKVRLKTISRKKSRKSFSR